MMQDIEVQSNGSIVVPATNGAARSIEVFEPAIDTFKDLYFRGQFQSLINAIDAMDSKRLSTNAYFKMNLLKTSALFEMHRTSEAKELISTLGQISAEETQSPDYVHMIARLRYLDENHEAAGQLWRELLSQKEAESHHFKSLIGVANVLYSQDRLDEIPALLENLTLLKTGVSKDESLSLLILKGNYYAAKGENLEKATECFNAVISESVGLGWTYFMIRGLFGLACVAQKDENLTTLRVHVDLMDSILKNSDNLLMKYLINKRFHTNGFVCSTDVDVDYESKRIRLNDKWFDFHKTPKLFEFFSVLYGSNTFVTKETIAKTLWDHEIYKPRSHDPRIFNIAKRVREVIEAYENQPIVILSGRFGYKLAARPKN